MDQDIYLEAARLAENGEPGVIATIVESNGSTPRSTGSKMLVRKDGSIIGSIGGGAIELAVIKEAQRRMYSNEPYMLEYTLDVNGNLGMACGGDAKVYIEPLHSSPKLFIFGAGHIGYHLSKMASHCDFSVVMVDDRADYANEERFPEASKIVVGPYPGICEKLNINENSYVVIATHGHGGDKDVLAQTIPLKPKYLGMIGSRSKNEFVYGQLKEQGFTDDDFKGLYAPIGLHIKAKSPEEIAVAILAELISVKHADDAK